MNLIRRLSLALQFALILPLSGMAFHNDNNDYSGQVSPLSMGFGVRSLGMGGAFVALARDADAMHWNPAGLSGAERHSVSLTHIRLFAETEYSSAAWAMRFGEKIGLGVSYSYLGTDDFPEVNSFLLTGRMINYSTWQASFSAAYKPIKYVSLGATGRAMRESLFRQSAEGYGLDVGVQAYFTKMITAGAQIRNLASPLIALGSSARREPRTGVFGLGVSGLSLNKYLKTSFAFDLELIGWWDPKTRAGVEVQIGDNLAIRAGQKRGNPTFGAGFTTSFGRIDYAFEVLDGIDDAHKIGASFFFGVTEETRREKRRLRQEAELESRLNSARKDQLARTALRAREFMDEGQLDSSAVYFQFALSIDSSDSRALAGRAEVDQMQKELRAERELQDASEAKISEIPGSLEIARRLSQSGRIHSAIDLLSEIQGDPGADTLTLTLLDSLITVRKNWRENKLTLAQLAENKRNYTRALQLYGDVFTNSPEDSQARAGLSRVAKESAINSILVSAYEKFGRAEYDSAASLVADVLVRDPENASALRLNEQIIKALRPALGLEALSENPADLEKLARALDLARQENYVAAISILDSLLKDYPGNSELIRNKRQIELRILPPEK
ncbi:MAG: PorV/PorQ family protein [candidate division Zixibacteria bacterium]|nr:PorV/PorQ family protein [candidate division Zixibacteria bacterium]